MKQKKYTTSAQEVYLGIIPYSIQYSEWLESTEGHYRSKINHSVHSSCL